MNIYEELMQEPPGGHTPGDQAAEFLRAGGWRVFSPQERGVSKSGASAHRGVVHPSEHVDAEALRAAVVERLGFTSEEIETAFSNGRPSPQRASLRAKIDARLLALSRAGGNMLALAVALGWEVQEERGCCRKVARSLERAKAAGVAAA